MRGIRVIMGINRFKNVWLPDIDGLVLTHIEVTRRFKGRCRSLTTIDVHVRGKLKQLRKQQSRRASTWKVVDSVTTSA